MCLPCRTRRHTRCYGGDCSCPCNAPFSRVDIAVLALIFLTFIYLLGHLLVGIWRLA